MTFELTGTSLAMTRIIAWTQRPPGDVGRAFHIGSVELAPSRSKDEEVHLELTLLIARLSEKITANEFGEDV